MTQNIQIESSNNKIQKQNRMIIFDNGTSFTLKTYNYTTKDIYSHVHVFCSFSINKEQLVRIHFNFMANLISGTTQKSLVSP